MNCQTMNNAVTNAGGEGTLLANRYHIVRHLGQGGMGSVWLVEDTQLDGKPFAVKMLPSVLVSNKRAYRQLKDEALVAMKLTHSNIVTLRAFEENNGNPFLVMDYIKGQTLDDYLAEKGRLSEDETIRLLKPVAAALDFAHARGIVHRDVKPGNVMIAKDGTPYILDFGIAREIQETLTRVTGKLSSGTLLYMSPEQLNGESPKPAQDVYSFAAMAYECLKGEPPFVRGAIEDQIKNKPPEPLPRGRFCASVMAGLAKKPEDRPLRCEAVLGGGKEGTACASGGGRSRWIVPVCVLTTVVVAVAAYWRLAGVVRDDTAKTLDTPLAQETAHVPSLTSSGTRGVAGESTPAVREAMPTNPPPSAELPMTPPPSKPQPPQEPEAKPVPQQEPPRPDPEFVEMTNRLAKAAKMRDSEYGKVDHFRASPRGFANRLKRVDDARNRWTKIKATYAPKDMDEVRQALDAVVNETEWLRNEIGGMSDNKESRDIAVGCENAFNEFCDAEENANKVLFARVRSQSEWKVVNAEIELARQLIDFGQFTNAIESYSNLHVRVASMLEKERKSAVKAVPSKSNTIEPPSMTVVAFLNGCRVSGAKMKKMDGEVTLPYKWEGAISKGRPFGPYTVTYLDGGVTYAGEFKTTVNWDGHREVPVVLRRLRPGEVPGGVRGTPKGIGSWAF